MKSTNQAKRDKSPGCTILQRLSVNDLMKILGLSKSGVRKRARLENWPFEEIPVAGGLSRLYLFQGLPAEIQRAIRIHYGEIPAELVECVPGDFDGERVQRCAERLDAARERQREVARRRVEILRRLQSFQESFRKGARAAVDAFVKQYRAGTLQGVNPEIYEWVPNISRSRLYEWQRAFNEQGIAGLLDSRGGHNRGQSGLTLEQRRFLLGLYKKRPRIKCAAAARLVEAECKGGAVTRRQVARFLEREREKDPGLFSYVSNPDQYKSQYELALGSASERAKRFLHYVEIDSTPADVLCDDNKRYTIIGLIDIFSRKCKFLVTKTSNSWGIAGLLRATILDWGVPENVVRDNGQDYVSRLVSDALTALEVNDITLPPFTPQGKPHIERVFRTLSHGLFELLPGYIGHNVADRQEIRERTAFADRFGRRQETISVGLKPSELQAAINGWAEQVYHQREHSSIGASPNARQASCPQRPRRIPDARALDILLAPSGLRTVGKKGLRYANGEHWADDLIDWIGRKVVVRTDMREAGRIYCFDPETKQFLCEALDMAQSGMTIGEKIAARKRANKRVRERARALKTLAAEVGDPLAEELEAARHRSSVTNLPVGDPVKGNPFLDAAMAAAEMGRASIEDRSTEERDPAVLFPQEAVKFADPPPRDPKIVPFLKKEQQQVERLYFKTAIEKFDYYRILQRTQAVPDEEIRSLQILISEWWNFADMFSEQWPECDRLWLGRIAPDHFPEYVVEDGK